MRRPVSTACLLALLAATPACGEAGELFLVRIEAVKPLPPANRVSLALSIGGIGRSVTYTISDPAPPSIEIGVRVEDDLLPAEIVGEVSLSPTAWSVQLPPVTLRQGKGFAYRFDYGDRDASEP